MRKRLFNRRNFALTSTGLVLAGATSKVVSAHGLQEEKQATQEESKDAENKGPVEADFERDYDPPSFKPKWARKQVNRTMAQDFVIFAHNNLDMVKKLYEREPALLNASIDWGNGDFETALGGASHMGRVDIIKFLLSNGARMNIFCAATMSLIGTVKEMLILEPQLIDAKGPHGFTLHWHAQIGAELGHENGQALLDHLQSIKELELRPIPFLRNRKGKGDSKGKGEGKAKGK